MLNPIIEKEVDTPISTTGGKETVDDDLEAELELLLGGENGKGEQNSGGGVVTAFDSLVMKKKVVNHVGVVKDDDDKTKKRKGRSSYGKASNVHVANDDTNSNDESSLMKLSLNGDDGDDSGSTTELFNITELNDDDDIGDIGIAINSVSEESSITSESNEPSQKAEKEKDIDSTNNDIKKKGKGNKISEKDLLRSTDKLFESANKDTVTVADIVRELEKEYGDTKLKKKQRKMVRQRLTDLITALHDEQDDDDDEDNSVSTSTSTSTTDTNDGGEEFKENIDKKLHNKLIKQQQKTEKAQKETIKEELDAARAMEEKKASKEDRKRMEAIRQKFETSSEEALLRRSQDRAGLLQKLKQKRMDVIDLSLDNNEKEQDKKDDEKEKGSTDDKMMITLEDDDEASASTNSTDEDDSDDSDDELEIVPQAKENLSTPIKKFTNPLSALAILESPTSAQKRHYNKHQKQTLTSSSSFSNNNNARFQLRQSLKQKQQKASQFWLAKELGYSNEQEHLLECQRIAEKRKQAIQKKELFLMKEHEKKAKLFTDYHNGEVGDEDNNDNDDEEDEELALAREIELEQNNDEDEDSQEKLLQQEHEVEDDSQVQDKGDDTLDNSDNHNLSPTIDDPNNNNNMDIDSHADVNDRLDETETEIEIETAENNNELNNDTNTKVIESTNKEITEENITSPPTKQSQQDLIQTTDIAKDKKETVKKPKKDRNLAFKAMLAKERTKKNVKSALLENEAEEELEEDEFAGLEDFGFIVKQTNNNKSNNNDDDDEHVDKNLTKEDLDHIVDELSDDEGDEEAGENARKKMLAKEEKERHKEILRRMRDGYDGRRGNIATSGTSASRGMHRFEQITAAGNKQDAKRLGLLNDDEMDSDSDDEEKEFKDGDNQEDSTTNNKEVEDEHVLLDQMLKERFIGRKEEENFFQDEEDEENNNDNDEGGDKDKSNDSDDEEERTQDRLSQVFTKRARMNRMLDVYDGDSEFSMSRLIDDESLSQDLKSIKCVLSRKRHQLSHASTLSSSSSMSNNNNNNKGDSSENMRMSIGTGKNKNNNSNNVALSLSIGSRSKKRKNNKITFSQNNSLFGTTKSSSAGFQRSVTISHVTTSSSSQKTHTTNNNKQKMQRSQSLPNKNHKKAATSSSLWSRVSKNRFGTN